MTQVKINNRFIIEVFYTIYNLNHYDFLKENCLTEEALENILITDSVRSRIDSYKERDFDFMAVVGAFYNEFDQHLQKMFN
jgi:hypothetical protein